MWLHGRVDEEDANITPRASPRKQEAHHLFPVPVSPEKKDMANLGSSAARELHVSSARTHHPTDKELAAADGGKVWDASFNRPAVLPRRRRANFGSLLKWLMQTAASFGGEEGPKSRGGSGVPYKQHASPPANAAGDGGRGSLGFEAGWRGISKRKQRLSWRAVESGRRSTAAESQPRRTFCRGISPFRRLREDDLYVRTSRPKRTGWPPLLPARKGHGHSRNRTDKTRRTHGFSSAATAPEEHPR